MRYLEVRRHSMRYKPGQHLTEAGIALARRVGQEMGPFDLVVTSTKPRAVETAEAMGFAVDEQLDALSELGDDVEAEVHYDAGFAEFSRVIALGGATARFSQALADLWTSVVERVPEGGRALIITHGGLIEVGAIGCLPKANHRAWGAASSYCEGVRLTFDGGRFTAAEILHVPSQVARGSSEGVASQEPFQTVSHPYPPLLW